MHVGPGGAAGPGGGAGPGSGAGPSGAHGAELAGELARRHAAEVASLRGYFESELTQQRTKLSQLQADYVGAQTREAAARLRAPAVRVPHAARTPPRDGVTSREGPHASPDACESAAWVPGASALFPSRPLEAAASPPPAQHASHERADASAREMRALADEGFALAARLAREATHNGQAGGRSPVAATVPARTQSDSAERPAGDALNEAARYSAQLDSYLQEAVASQSVGSIEPR
jgi:hypothetical protein